MTALKLENLKLNDWIIGESTFFDTIMPIIRQVKAYPKYDKNMGQDYTLTLNDDILFKSNYKYLTIKPEAMQKNTVIHCSEKWMAEALCWVMDKLGKRWCNGESFLANTQWKYYQKKICYNFYDGKCGKCSYYKHLDYKIIPFWDAVCGEDFVGAYDNNKGEKEICGEKKYEWNTNYNYISVNSMLNAIPECIAKEDFKVWCFEHDYSAFSTIYFRSDNGDILLKELHKPNRKAWLNFAIRQGYVKEFKPKPTFRVGDVIEITEGVVGVESRYIINACKKNAVCLNSIKGARWGDMFSVEDVGNIKYEEIYNKIRKNFKKVGHGINFLI
jgi:hypothetical protein